jgi:hypothetical protein
MLFKCDYMFSVISKAVYNEFNSVHQGKNGRNRCWLYGTGMDSYKSRISNGVLIVLVQKRNRTSLCLKFYGLCLNFIGTYLGSRGKHFFQNSQVFFRCVC